MVKKREMFIIFMFGAVIYSIVEILFRGYTHWTMAIAGGTAFSLIYILNINIKTKSFLIRCLAGSIIITAIEFAAGMIVNVGFGMHVWDYSHIKFNILGQICPLFSFFWFLLCIPATVLSILFRSGFIKDKTA